MAKLLKGGASLEDVVARTGLSMRVVSPAARALGRRCAFPKCGRPIKALGLCKAHHEQKWNGKELRALRRTVKERELEIENARIERESYERGRAAANALLMAENDALKRRVAELEAELAEELDGVGNRESQRVRDLVDQLRDAQGSRDLYKSGCVGLEMRLKAALKLLGKPYSESTLEALGGPTSRSEDDPST